MVWFVATGVRLGKPVGPVLSRKGLRDALERLQAGGLPDELQDVQVERLEHLPCSACGLAVEEPWAAVVPMLDHEAPVCSQCWLEVYEGDWSDVPGLCAQCRLCGEEFDRRDACERGGLCAWCAMYE